MICRIKVFASQYLKIVELSFKMNEELLKNEIGSLTNVRVEMDSTL